MLRNRGAHVVMMSRVRDETSGVIIIIIATIIFTIVRSGWSSIREWKGMCMELSRGIRVLIEGGRYNESSG